MAWKHFYKFFVVYAFCIVTLLSSTFYTYRARQRSQTYKDICIRYFVNGLEAETEMPHEQEEKLEIQWDSSNEYWQIWEDNASSNCSQYKTRFARGLPQTSLLSFPGSGNTWIRYLLEAATGIFTGSVFDDRSIQKEGYLGEFDDPNSGRTIVQKTHGVALYRTKANLRKRFQAVIPDVPAVVVIRNPFRAFISYWNLIQSKTKSDKHTAKASKESFKTKEFSDFVAELTEKWEQLVTDRLLWSSAPVHIVYYDLLVDEPIDHIRQVLHFLRVPIDEGRLACLHAHLQGSFKRTKKEDFDPYTKEEKESIALAVRRVNKVLNNTGFRELPPFADLL